MESENKKIQVTRIEKLISDLQIAEDDIMDDGKASMNDELIPINDEIEKTEEEYKFYSFTREISFIELAIINSYLHSCYLKKT